MTYAWTAAKVWDLVRDWPEEARPKPDFGHELVPRLEFRPANEECGACWVWMCERQYAKDGTRMFWGGCVSASALHVASGLEWLGANGWEITYRVASRYNVDTDPDARPIKKVGEQHLVDVFFDGGAVHKDKWHSVQGPTLLHAIAAAIAAVTTGG